MPELSAETEARRQMKPKEKRIVSGIWIATCDYMFATYMTDLVNTSKGYWILRLRHRAVGYQTLVDGVSVRVGVSRGTMEWL